MEHGGVAARPHIVQNGGNRLLDGTVLRILESKQRIEARGKIGIGRRQAFECGHHALTTWAMASRIGAILARLSLSAA